MKIGEKCPEKVPENDAPKSDVQQLFLQSLIEEEFTVDEIPKIILPV